MKGIVTAFLCAVFLISCAKKEDKTESPKSDSLKRVDSIANLLHKDSLKFIAFKDSVYRKGWHRDTSVDKMRGTVMYLNDLYSSNEENFNAPYDGGSHGVITVRIRGSKTEVMFSITRGMIDARSDGTPIAVKFDSLPIQNFVGTTSDVASGMVFIHPPDKFLNFLKKSHHVMIEARIYREGKQVFDFDVEEL